MPSIKSCLLALAVMAMAVAPINAAKHTESAVARRAAAARALAKRQETNDDASAYQSKAWKSQKKVLAAQRIRCGTDTVCERRTAAAPANGQAVCVSGRCDYRCNSGFAPGGTDGTECVASQSSCGTQDCAVPTNGYATCDTTGACVVGCNAGFVRYSTNEAGTAPYFCFATATDANNCGSPGNICPSSYNGIGTPSCKSGNCRIQCPAGSFLRKAASTTNPYYCYNGEDSLVRN
ncbi:hypothetical protein JCM8547_002446 [Rhodosporidiobolus lusitaniae]